MHPAFSVIFLTTLIGAGQGLFMALVTGQVYSLANLLEPQDSVTFYATGSFLAMILLGGGLVAAVFHLGKPSYFLTRAWRGITQWRTSWLSRELLALPAFMVLVILFGGAHFFELTEPLFVDEGTVAGRPDPDSRRCRGVLVDCPVRLDRDDLRESAIPAGMA